MVPITMHTQVGLLMTMLMELTTMLLVDIILTMLLTIMV
jgi:hypothetical protein